MTSLDRVDIVRVSYEAGSDEIRIHLGSEFDLRPISRRYQVDVQVDTRNVHARSAPDFAADINPRDHGIALDPFDHCFDTSVVEEYSVAWLDRVYRM